MSDRRAVAITGGGGFIGHALVVHQARRGRRVRSLDVAHPAPLPGGLDPAPVRRDGTILERADLDPTFDGADVVYHLASAHLEVKEGESYFRRINVDGTRAVIAAAKEAGARRVVHVSTVGVYGQMTGERFDESSPTRPTIPYERTKLEGEQAAREAADAAGIELTIVRPSWVFGADCRRTQKIFRGVRKGRFLRVGACREGRDGIYIDDCLDGLERCGTHPDAAGETYILASGDAPSIDEWIDEIARAQGVKPPRLRVPVWPMWLAGLGAECAFKLVGKDAPFSRRSLKFFTNGTVFDNAKIRGLGFEPAVGWREGLKRTATHDE